MKLGGLMDYSYNKIRLTSFAIIIFFIDQFSKLIALHFLEFDKEFKVNSLVSLHRIFNTRFTQRQKNQFTLRRYDRFY